jgi:5'-methylthioadenosine phosphorylase
MTVGFIAGTGFEHLFASGERRRQSTPFGRFDYLVSRQGGERVIVIPRHGFAHEFSPFRMPSKAYLFGLRAAGIRRVLAASSVATANEKMSPGDIVLPDQFIDLTKTREATFYNFDVTVHTDMTEPFCESIRQRLQNEWAKEAVTVHGRGVYVATEGPRYETPAEIRMIQAFGGDLIGQSAATEAVLARELGMCYALIAVISSRAAGLQLRKDSRDILDSIWSRAPTIGRLVRSAIPAVAHALRRPKCLENKFESDVLLQRLRNGKAR